MVQKTNPHKLVTYEGSSHFTAEHAVWLIVAQNKRM